MVDVVVGKGKLAGKGVYAARDFREGELVVPYNLQELRQSEFDALPAGEWEWTHSFHGRIYLFREPERYVNHSDDPSTFPDLDRMGDYALRPIRTGEAITINDRIELQNELNTFFDAYEKAVNSQDVAIVAPFVADSATFWHVDDQHEGKQAVVDALLNTFMNAHNEALAISNIQWTARNYWVSACTCTFESQSMENGTRHVRVRSATCVLARLNGSWRISHKHLSR